MSMSRLWVAVPVALVLAACGGAVEGPDTTPVPTTSPTTEGAIPATTSSSPTSSTTSPTTSPTTTAPPANTLPGEPIDIGPAAGDVLAVMGVAHDDGLNVRAAPGTDQPVVTILDPTADDAVATGRARKLPRSIWWELEANGVVGWASSSFLTYLGSTNDITAQVIERMGWPAEHESMGGLGRMVADALASHDEPVSRITLTVAPSVGDLGEVIYDVVGFADDSVRGVRLHVFGEPDGDGFTLRAVEGTVFCGRGVDGAGLCV